MSSTAVLVHNEHGKILGKIAKDFPVIASKIQGLAPDIAARVTLLVDEYKNPLFQVFRRATLKQQSQKVYNFQADKG